MSKGEFFYVQSSLCPGTPGVLAELAGKFDRCALTSRAVANLPKRFRDCESGCVISFIPPTKTSPGLLFADGAELLTITTIKSIIYFGGNPTKSEL